MKIRTRTLLAMLCALWFGATASPPAAAFDAGKNRTWVQFFDQNRRGTGQNQYRPRRNNDLVPLRTDPGQERLRMRDLRRQDRNRLQRQEQDAAREAVRRGEILPLGGIIQSVQSYCAGKFLGAKLQRGQDGFSYRVRILRPSGRRIGLMVDAKTGAVIGGRCR